MRRRFSELMETTEWANYGTESGQSQVRELHGAQWIRSIRSGLHVRFLQGIDGRGQSDAVYAQYG